MTGSSSQAGLASFRHRGLSIQDQAVLHARNILGPTNWGDPGWDEYQALINEYVEAHEPNETGAGTMSKSDYRVEVEFVVRGYVYVERAESAEVAVERIDNEWLTALDDMEEIHRESVEIFEVAACDHEGNLLSEPTRPDYFEFRLYDGHPAHVEAPTRSGDPS